MGSFYYESREVSKEVYEFLDLGDVFMGGIVIEGITDDVRNVHVVVTRHNDEEHEDWKAHYITLRSLVDRMFTAIKIQADQRVNALGPDMHKRIVQEGYQQSTMNIAEELFRARAAVPAVYETEDHALVIETDVLVIRDRDTFKSLPVISEDDDKRVREMVEAKLLQLGTQEAANDGQDVEDQGQSGGAGSSEPA